MRAPGFMALAASAMLLKNCDGFHRVFRLAMMMRWIGAGRRRIQELAVELQTIEAPFTDEPGNQLLMIAHHGRHGWTQRCPFGLTDIGDDHSFAFKPAA